MDLRLSTTGFEALGFLTNKPPTSLIRMFGPSGNPRARNLFEVMPLNAAAFSGMRACIAK